MMQAFQFLVFHQPKDDSLEKATIIVDVQTVLAKDQGSATLLAARRIPETWAERMDELVVVVRPF